MLYCGLMMTARGPMVLEFNCRFGDPETQPILMRLESDLVEALEASIEGRVSEGDFRWSPDASVCVVMASGGYPGTFEAGRRITGLAEARKVAGVEVFHAGTTKHDECILHFRRSCIGSYGASRRSQDRSGPCISSSCQDRIRGSALPQGHCRAGVEKVKLELFVYSEAVRSRACAVRACRGICFGTADPSRCSG